MKLKVALVLTVAVLAAAHWNAGAQAQRGRRGTPNGTPPASAVANEALLQALAGPEGEYANLAEYSAMVEKFGQIQPYAAILRSEECHIAALKRHLELRGVAVPENSFLGIVTAPATFPEAAEAAISAEEKNVAMYDRLLEKVKDQPDLVQVFTHLQFASREHHLPAFKAAAEKGGQLQAGEFRCGMGCGMGAGQGRGGAGGPPPWAGGAGSGCGQGLRGQGGCGGGACVQSQSAAPSGGKMGAGRGFRRGAAWAQEQ